MRYEDACAGAANKMPRMASSDAAEVIRNNDDMTASLFELRVENKPQAMLTITEGVAREPASGDTTCLAAHYMAFLIYAYEQSTACLVEPPFEKGGQGGGCSWR